MGGLSGLFDNPITGYVLAGPLGGLYGLSQQQQEAADRAAAGSQFAPLGIQTGIGSVGFGNIGGDSKGFTGSLSPEYQALRDQLMGIGATGLNQFQTFDPMQAAGLFTGQLNTMAAPQEQQQRTQLENRLFKQGLLTSSAGADRFGELAQAQAMAQNQRNLMGYEYGTTEQQRLFQNALGGIQGASALDQLLSQQINQALAASGAQTTANTNAAQFQFQADMNRNDMLAGFFSGLMGPSSSGQPQGNFIANLFG